MRCGVATLTARIQCLWTRLHRAQELLRVSLRRAGQHGGVQRVGFGHRVWGWLGWDVVLACQRGSDARSDDDPGSVHAGSGCTPWGQRRSSSARGGPAARPRFHHSVETGRRRPSRHAAAMLNLNLPAVVPGCRFQLHDVWGASTAACSPGVTFRTWAANAQRRLKEAVLHSDELQHTLHWGTPTVHPMKILNRAGCLDYSTFHPASPGVEGVCWGQEQVGL
jgi:hypothetical protein